ncbi:hypothetical protein B0G74_2208 [Paraburkholderia sp. BL9I2N2]|nr:hypothetical protein B0G74_2208 [Paraburkholderia sp. BL9I2N2]
MPWHKDTMIARSQAFACIGWGSLIWDSRTLPLIGGWRIDGPILPLEFARESADGRITLVICEHGTPVRTLWTMLAVPDLITARRQLGIREFERATPEWIDVHIGFWDRATGLKGGAGAETVAQWADSQGFAGAVWTSLECGFRGARRGTMPTVEEVILHLQSLHGAERISAKEYIRRAPR